MDPDATRASASPDNFGLAWILLCLAFCSHVADEALTGFLNVYNPTVIAMRDRLNWFPNAYIRVPRVVSGTRRCQFGPAGAHALRLPQCARPSPLAYFFAGVMLLNGMGHTVFTVLGRTVASVQFPRPAPGFYSSPFLLITSIYLFMRLRTSRQAKAG